MRHYVLRDIDDDVKLSELLVTTVLGETVPWPMHHQLNDVQVLAKDLLRLPWTTDSDTDDLATSTLDADTVDGDTMEFEWWQCAEIFGISKPLDPVCDLEPEICAPIDLPSIEVGPSNLAQPTGTGSNAVRVESKKRKYILEGGKWSKHEEAPNLIEHKPPPAKRQLSMWDLAVSMNPSASSSRAPAAVVDSVPSEVTREQVSVVEVDGASEDTKAQVSVVEVDGAVFAVPGASASCPVTAASQAPEAARGDDYGLGNQRVAKKSDHKYTAAEIEWILAEHSAAQPLGVRYHTLEKTKWFEELLKRGVSTEKLSKQGSTQGIRSLVRRHVEHMNRETAHQDALAERREKYAAKKLERQSQ